MNLLFLCVSGIVLLETVYGFHGNKRSHNHGHAWNHYCWDHAPSPLLDAFCPLLNACGDPTVVEHGSHGALTPHTDGGFRIQTAYTCDNDYVITGSDVVTCNLTTTAATTPSWSVAPVCNTKTCVEPLTINNGSILDFANTTDIGQVVTYTCDDSYVISGNDTSVCLPDLTWSKPLPVCTEIVCPEVPNIANGNVHGNHSNMSSVGTVVDYMCIDGYTFVNTSNVKCTTTGSWSEPQPLCLQSGTPFGKVKGPSSKNDRIAIIGAGASGIHMAYKLKDLGFKHVTIFESSGRIGGKSSTLYHRRVPQEMGTCYGDPDYTAIYDLVREFKAGELKSMPDPVFWNEEKGSYVQGNQQSYVLKIVYEVKGISDPSAAFAYYQQAIGRYIALHVALFGTYEGELMPRPSEDTLRNITCSFLELLKRNDLEVMKATFRYSHTSMGYGYLNEIPALYGLLWNTPNLLSNPQAVKILDNGFQFLWEEIARQTSLDIRYYHEVNYIKRVKIQNQRKYVIDIYYSELQCKNSTEQFDFLIITPTMKMMLEKMDSKREEKELFSNTHQTYFTTTVLDTDYGVNRPLSPSSIFLSDIGRKINNFGWALRDSFASLSGVTGDAYRNGSFPDGPDGKFVQTSVFYQMSNVKQTSNAIYKKLARYIKRVPKMKIKGDLVKQVIWSYFPRYSKEDLADGVLWNIYDIQGKYNTWYIGSSVCFESVMSVVEYNLLLLRNYDVPN